MDFQPLTDIWFCRTGIDENNKVVCKTQEELFNTITREGNVQGRTEKNSFQRADGLFMCRVDHSQIPYYTLLQCDTIIYMNKETTAAFWVVGNIISVEWKNPDCSFVRFKLDHFMTYQTFIDWDKTMAYVEREHVKEDWANGGTLPLFTNIGPMEDFRCEPDTPIYHRNINYGLESVLISSPYDDSGKPTFNGGITSNMFTSLETKVRNPADANAFFKKIADTTEASINNIVDVRACPRIFEPAINGEPIDSELQLPPVEKSNMTSFPIEYNNAKCWSAPYCVIKLMSSEGSEMVFNPQWFGNEQTNYTLRTRIIGAGKQFASALATFDNGAGAFDWKSWAEFTVILSELPKCPWTADGFANWWAVNKFAVIGRAVSTTVNTALNVGKDVIKAGAGDLTGAVDGIKEVVSFGQYAMDEISNISSVQSSGAVVNGTGSYSSLGDVGQHAWGFKVVYYVVQNYIMRSIDQYFDRFGYRVNKLKKLERENRPIWTFIKTAECHVAATTGIPFLSELAINQMFNRGVTMWKNDKYMSGTKIGDFSQAKDNRGIK